MKLSDVLCAAMALTPEDRLKLVDAIAVVDDWHVDIVDKPEAVTEPKAAAKNKNHNERYTSEELAELQEIASRTYFDSSFGSKDRTKAIQRVAKKYGRTADAIRTKVNEMYNAGLVK